MASPVRVRSSDLCFSRDLQEKTGKEKVCDSKSPEITRLEVQVAVKHPDEARANEQRRGLHTAPPTLTCPVMRYLIGHIGCQSAKSAACKKFARQNESAALSRLSRC